MVKANIETDTGLKISIEGTADEISNIIANVKKTGEQKQPTLLKSGRKKRKSSTNSPSGLKDLILSLKSSGFFDKPQKIANVKEILAQQAQHYSIQSISTTLIRTVKKGELGRVKDGKEWVYVKR